MSRHLRRPMSAWFVAVMLTTLSAQERPQIRSGIELVTVDVQVVDRGGNPVATLRADDFEVSIDGQRRSVTSAEFLSHGAGIYVPDAPGTAAAAAGRPGEAATARPRRIFVIAVDEHSIGMSAAQSAMQAVRRFVGRVPAGDLIGLVAYPTGAVTVDLTTDRALVLKALEGITGLLDRPLMQINMSASEAIDIASGDRDVQRTVTQRECRTDMYCSKLVPLEAQSLALMFEMKIAQSLGGLRGLVDGLATIPGRKTLVLVSGGLLISDRANGRATAPGDLTAVGRAAAASNTTIYALHMDSSFLDAFSASRGGGVPHTLFRDSGMFATGLEMIAGANGGDVVRIQAGTADSALDRVLRETSAHYLLGVEVTDADRDGDAHAIRVRVKGRGLTVRARASVVVPKAGAKPTASDTRRE
jgi:VWFA-related protein